MNIDTLIRFYVNNGTEKTIQMIKENHLESNLSFFAKNNENCSYWAKEVIKHLVQNI